MNDSSIGQFHALPSAPPEEAGLLPDGLARLQTAMGREIASERLPGVAMLIARGGRIGHRSALGALKPGGPAMRGDAIFRIYSMTKPIVSVALMMLVEQGRILLSDPLAKYIPEFAAPKVGVERDGRLELVAAERPITIHDLLRHTSGLTYGHTGDTAVQRLYAKAPLRQRTGSSAGFITMLAALPLIAQPGASWDYSHSTDVVGRVIEIVSGQSLGAFLGEHILGPLGMNDTGFHAPADRHERLAEPFDADPDTGEKTKLLDPRVAPGFEGGGSGLVSTIDDYARFLEMLRCGGTLGQIRILSRKTLGFAVRRETGMAPAPGTIGEYFWSGIAGTCFWVAPAEDLFAVMMIQAPGQRTYYRELFRNLVHGAIA
jgi:CubicO group peptidase (beta-lactamase class C family)